VKITVQLLILFVLIFNSCSIKKRTYRDGYFISWNHKNKHIHQQEKKDNEPVAKIKGKTNIEPVLDDTIGNNFASVKAEVLPFKENKPKWNLFKDTCGDVVALRTGSEIKAKVLEINETQVKYRRCDNLDGPLIIVNKNDVYSIKYSTGLTEFFDKSVAKPVNGTSEKVVHPLAYATLACTVGILVLSVFSLIAALIIGTIARREILKNPTKYSGLEMVNICMTICWIMLALAVILIFIIISLI